MFCVNCGAELREGAKFCPKCGTPVNMEQTPLKSAEMNGQEKQQSAQWQGEQQTKENAAEPQKSDAMAIGALVLGIVGVVVSFFTVAGAIIALIMSIVGVILAVKSRKDHGPSGLSTAGLVLSIIGIIFGARGLVCLACMGALCGAAAGSLLYF